MAPGKSPLVTEKVKTLTALQEGELTVTSQFMESSNYTFLTLVMYRDLKFQAVYKPQKGETPLWDFPAGTLCKREVAAYLVSEALGWGLVPPTVFRHKAPVGRGALQVYVENNPDTHYFSFNEPTRKRLKPAVLFDLIINNADRKGSHILLDEHDHLWLIDHGTCFHHDYKLRSVVWNFAGQEIPTGLLNDMQNIAFSLIDGSDFQKDLQYWLSVEEVRALLTRINALLQLKTFPFPDRKRRAFPWPPL